MLTLTVEAWATELEADRRVLRSYDLPQDDERRNAKQLTGLLIRLRRLGDTLPLETFQWKAGIGFATQAPAFPLDFKGMDRLFYHVVSTAAGELGSAELAEMGGRNAFAQIMETVNTGKRFFVDYTAGGERRPGYRGDLAWRILNDLATGGDRSAASFIDWHGAMAPAMAKIAGEVAMKPKAAVAARYYPKSGSALHLDKAVGVIRSCTAVLRYPNSTKYLSFGITEDYRDDDREGKSASPRKWVYLGDMEVSDGDTYVGDRVAMGCARVGPGRSVGHKVNLGDGESWVIMVDWVPV